ncbi:MAG: biotin--[acetyl-CoA-carboxylase] ligase [Actinomycetota bacterium]
MRWDVRRYESLDSTNLEARRLLGRGASEGLVVTAAHQTAGRGRMDRNWLDLPGKSLLVSLVLREMEPFWAAATVALSARAAVIRLGGKGPMCKWPNDLVYGERKVGGVLAESFRRGGEEFLIVGLGINVGYLPGELNFPARLPPTSLLVEEGRLWDVEELLGAILVETGKRLWDEEGGWLEEYGQCLAYRGCRVVVENYVICGPRFMEKGSVAMGGSGDRLEGFLVGVDRLGNLLLETADVISRVASGDLAPLEP